MVAGSSHSREKLATLLWPESDRSRAFANLRVVLAALHSALGEGWLHVDRENVSLVPDPRQEPSGRDLSLPSGQRLWIDVTEFRDRLATCRTHGHSLDEMCPACLSALAEAVALYGDDFLSGFTLSDSPAYDEWQFFQAEGLRQQLASALERCASDGVDVRREQAFALWQMGDACYSAGREDTRQWFERSLALYRAIGDRWGEARVLYRLGGQVLGTSGALQEGKTLVQESLAIREALGDQRGTGLSRRSLAVTVCLRGHLEESERLLRQSLVAFQAVGDPINTAETLTNLAYVLLFLARPDEAYAQIGKSAAILSDLGIRDWLVALTLKTRADAALWLGRYPEARAFSEAGLAIAREIGRHNILAVCLRGRGMVEIIEGDYARAVRLLREGVAAARRVRSYNIGTCAVLSSLAALRQGQTSPSRRYLYEGLQTALEQGTYLPLLYGLPLAAAFLLEDGQAERAVELYALALEQPFVASSRWYADVVGQHVADAAATLPPEVVAAARERGRARDLWATARGLVAELAPEDG